jgi:hypothetical protein
MILVWSDAKSFSRHLENMRHFHKLHRADMKCGWSLIKDMPTLRDIRVPAGSGGTRGYLNAVGPMVVPLWKLTLPAGVKN